MNQFRPLPSLITTARVVLEPWRDDDLATYRELVHERDQRTAAAPRDGRPTDDDLRVTLARQQNSLSATGLTLFAVRLDDAFIGYCGLTVGRATADEPELAYELLRSVHGLGYATEAAQAVVAAAARTGRRLLWASVRPWNAASLRVLATLGFDATNKVVTDEFGESLWFSRRL